jgi:predicted outer membrane repeat protein
MYNEASSPNVVDCTFTGNRANAGGAVYVSGGAPRFSECSFELNETVNGGDSDENGPGGAIWCQASTVTVESCVFSANDASDGAAISSYETALTLTSTVFRENSAEDIGGALCLIGESNPEIDISNCVFRQNTAAALYYDAPEFGCGGGAIFSSSSTGLLVTNCSFANNDGTTGGGGICSPSATIANSVFYSDAPDELSGPDGFAHDVTYSLVSGGHDGEGNIDGDPLFVDAATGDLHLSAGSPCIDAADTSVAPEFDLEGNARVGDADMGAYEFTSGK